MDVITGPKGLDYVNERLRRFLRRKETRSPIPAVANEHGAFGGPNVAAWIDQKFPRDIFPLIRHALESGHQPRSQQSDASKSPRSSEFSEDISICSDVSSSTTLSEAELRDRQRSQFDKLLPSKDACIGATRAGPITIECGKSLRRKSAYPYLHRAARNACPEDGQESIYDDLDGQSSHKDTNSISSTRIPSTYSSDTNIQSPVLKGATKDTHLKHNTNITYGNSGSQSSSQDNENDSSNGVSSTHGSNTHIQRGLSSVGFQKREIPQGSHLLEVQLALKENILSDIADLAVEERRDFKKGKAKGKRQGLPANSDEEPEDLDRELEVNRELMKQLRKSLNDGTYRDMYVADSNGREEPMDGKYEILCEILLMLRRVFRDILARYARPYRPTGFVVTDQEMVKEMDEMLHVREKLLSWYPMTTICEFLDSLGRIGREADLKTLTGL